MNFHQIFIEIATAPSFPMDSFETSTLILWGSVFTSSSFEIFEICIFYFLANFHPIFSQIATAHIIFNGFL